MQENNRYQHSKIYKLVNDIDDTFYIGSTCNTLAKRFYDHKNDAKRRPKARVYEHLNKIGWEHVKIILIIEVALNSKDELRREEDKHNHEYRDDDNCLNVYRAFLTPEEDKIRIQISNQKYNIENNEKILQHKKQYYNDNREKIILRRKLYYEKNKDVINENKRTIFREIVYCDCGGKNQKNNGEKKHFETLKHKQWLCGQ